MLSYDKFVLFAVAAGVAYEAAHNPPTVPCAPGRAFAQCPSQEHPDEHYPRQRLPQVTVLSTSTAQPSTTLSVDMDWLRASS
jgi:hypothetical protein